MSTTDRWFRDRAGTWHRSARVRIAECGALADPRFPWTPRPPAGHVVCADCED